MQSERSTTEIHPLLPSTPLVIYYYHSHNPYELFTHISQCWLLVFILLSTPLVIYYYPCHNRYEVITHFSQCWVYICIVIFSSTPDMF